MSEMECFSDLSVFRICSSQKRKQRVMISAAKRLQKEAASLSNGPGAGHEEIRLKPLPSNIMEWTANIVGPPGSYYEGYSFDLRITVPTSYPMQPPTIVFVTKIFHPNVHFDTGEICLDILKKEWSPAWNLQSACRAIIALLSDPAPDSPLNCDAGNMLRAGDTRAYRSMTKMYCIECAIPTTSR